MKKSSLLLFMLCAAALTGVPAQVKTAPAAQGKTAPAAQGKKKAKAPEIKITCLPASHVAKIGEKVTFSVTSNSDLPAVVTVSLDGSAKKVFKSITSKAPVNVTVSLAYPGFLHCHVRSGKTVARAAVAVAPEKIRYSRKAPADFEKFWADAFKESAKLPLDLKAEAVNPHKEYDTFLLSCANVNGKRAYAFYTAPKNVKGKIPLMVYFGGGEAYISSSPFPSSAIRLARLFKRPMAVLYFHLPPYRPGTTWDEARTMHQKFLKELGLRRYILVGMDSPKTFYAYSAILGCLRLLEHTANRPEIDKTKVLFKGASHGGKIGAYLAAFFPLKAAFLGVPSSCEINAHLEGRYGSAAREWVNYAKTSDYFDLVYFAPKIKCPVLVTLGHVDRSCPPTGVCSFYNAIPEGKKKLFAKLRHGHGDNPPGYDAMVWKFLTDQLTEKK